MKRLILFFSLTLCITAFADESPKIEASVFCETFDAVTDIGGNDGIFSYDAPIDMPIVLDNGQQSTLTNIRGGAQCIRLGTSNKLSEYSINNLPFKGKGSITYRGGLWAKSKSLKIKVKVKDMGSNTYDLVKEKMDEYSIPITSTSESLTVTFTNNVERNPTYLFLDNVTIYKDVDIANDEGTELKTARKVILSGTFNKANVDKINFLLVNNKTVVSINVEKAIFPEGSVISVGNPNVLIYASASSHVANTKNVVIDGQCENLVLKDGDEQTSYPFYAEKDFQATNVSYDRKFTLGGNDYSSTIYLPFAVDAKKMNLSYIAQLSSYRHDTQEGVFTFQKKEISKPNEPCLIQAKTEQPFLNLKGINANVKNSTTLVNPSAENGYNVLNETFKGVYSLYTSIKSDETSMTNTGRYYGLSQGQMVKVSTEGGVFKPFRGFISIPTSDIPQNNKLTLSFTEPTIIQKIKINSQPSTEIYDLKGRIINSNAAKVEKGIYIINHKKVFIK